MNPGNCRILAMIAAISMIFLSGCSSPPPSTAPEGPGRPPQGANHRPLLDYQTIWFQNSGESIDGERIGFLGIGPTSDALDPTMMTNVYNLDWQMVGFIVENGTTFRIHRNTSEKVGNFPIAEGIQVLFRRSGTIRITPGI